MCKEGIEKQETVQQTDYTKVTCNYITLGISLRYMLYFLTHKGMVEVSVIQVNVRNIAVGHMCRITMVTRPRMYAAIIFWFTVRWR